MFKLLILFLCVQQIFSINEPTASISANPLFTKILGLVDQLLLQVRKMQSLIIRTYNMIDRMPVNLRPFFVGCFTATHNATRIEYSFNLNEAEMIRIPKIKDQLKQATTLEQQLSIMNVTDRIMADISLNVVKPSLSFVTEILDCLKSKSQFTLV